MTTAANLLMDFDCPNRKAIIKKYGGTLHILIVRMLKTRKTPSTCQRLSQWKESFLVTWTIFKRSPLWKDVLIFDNEWLEEQGLYKSETHWLNEKKMKEIVRMAMNKMIEEEKVHDSIWAASY